MAVLDNRSGYIDWQCPLCGDYGTIHGWENTLWNRNGGVRQRHSDAPSTVRH